MEINGVSQMAELYPNHKDCGEWKDAQPTDWFAVHTKYQHERCVESALRAKGFRTFLPAYKEVRRWSDRKKIATLPLFPGYLFAGEAIARKLEILTVPGACDIVSTHGIPAAIPREEMEMVMKVAACAENLQPHPFLAAGDKVKVIEGALTGVEGVLVREMGKCRLVISIELLGRSAAVGIDRQCVTPLWASGSSGREQEIARLLFSEQMQGPGCPV